ncbi:hypothetical protein [Paenibacillus sp. PL91]|nr:hypothetical protein [Paenibacillus sp. PL91]
MKKSIAKVSAAAVTVNCLIDSNSSFFEITTASNQPVSSDHW